MELDDLIKHLERWDSRDGLLILAKEVKSLKNRVVELEEALEMQEVEDDEPHGKND